MIGAVDAVVSAEIAAETAAKPENRELLSKALALLSRRDRPRVEFIAKLIAAGFSRAEVEEAARWCEVQGFLSDTRYVEGAARRLSARYGASRVMHTLRNKGIGEEALAAIKPDLKAGELERARLLWARKFDALPVSAGERAKQSRFLQSRGFGFDIIKQLFAGA